MAHDLLVGASASVGAHFCHYDSLNQGTQACDFLLREPPNCAAVGPQEKYQGRRGGRGAEPLQDACSMAQVDS